MHAGVLPANKAVKKVAARERARTPARVLYRPCLLKVDHDAPRRLEESASLDYVRNHRTPGDKRCFGFRRAPSSSEQWRRPPKLPFSVFRIAVLIGIGMRAIKSAMRADSTRLHTSSRSIGEDHFTAQRPPPELRRERLLAALCWGSVLAMVFIGSSSLQALAQAADGHSEHHPGSAASPNMSAPPGRAEVAPDQLGTSSPLPFVPGPADQSGGMGPGAMGPGAMGEMMGGRPPKEFYPALMDFPVLTSEQRQAIEAEARVRIRAGTDEIAAAENALRHANAAGDAAAAEHATRRLREGLNQASSGIAALRALAEGKGPQQIARDWFKGQLNLTPDVRPFPSTGPFGLSWFHLMTMALMVAFVAAMIAIYFARMRRANALVDRLSSAPQVLPISAASSTSLAPLRSTFATTKVTTPAQASISREAAAVPARAAAPVASATARQTAIPWKGQLRVAAIFDETPNVKTFRLRDPQGGPIPFTFVPGQFLTYAAEIDGKRARRSYTIASSAAQTSYLETTIKRESPGIFSGYMHEKIVEGDLVDVTAPSGFFTFTGTEADSVVLIGGGVGITPLMAAIRYLNDIAWPGDIFLVYGARTTKDFIFRDEIEYLQRRHRNLHVAATMARAEGTAWMGHEGPITKEFLTVAVPEIAKRRVHLCGPPGMMETVKNTLAELGLPGDQVRTEAFGPARGAVPPPGITLLEVIQPPVGGATVTAPSAPPTLVAAAIGPATTSIRFAKSDKVAPLPPDMTVLEVAEAVGVNIDYACRIGVCGTCKTRLLEGKVTMEVEDALTPEDTARNIILACQAKSIGNLVVDA